MSSNCLTGAAYPLGAALQADGVNFNVYSKNALLVEVLLFDSADAIKPKRVIRLYPHKHRTYHYWRGFVPGLKAGQIYGFNAFGPFEPERGLRFGGDKVLLDPYGRAVTIPADYSRERVNPAAMKSVVVDSTPLAAPATTSSRIAIVRQSCAGISRPRRVRAVSGSRAEED